MAKGIADEIIQNRQLEIQTQSRGLMAQNGQPASPNATAALAEKGIDLCTHQSKLFMREDGEWADAIFVMTAPHYDWIAKNYPQFQGKTFMLSEQGIGDPYGGDLACYRQCASALETAIVKILSKITDDPES